MKIFSLTNVLNKFDRGWAEIDLLGGERVVLPYGTTFGFIQENTLMILGGHHKGEFVDLSKKDRLFQLLSGCQIIESNLVAVKCILGNNQLIFPDGKTYTLAKSSKKMLPIGMYKLEVPRAPHYKLCKKVYLDESIGGSRFAETWFEIVPERGERLRTFMHYGEVSDGCLTVSMQGNLRGAWTDIYFSLILNRIEPNFVASLMIV